MDRGGDAAADKPSANVPAAPTTTAADTALRVPRRLLMSSLQLAQLLTTTLGDLRLSLELRRLHKVLATALTPLVATLLRHHQSTLDATHNSGTFIRIQKS